MKELQNLREKFERTYNYWLDLEELTMYNRSTVSLIEPITINGIEYSSLTGSLGVLQPAQGTISFMGASVTFMGVHGWDINLNTAIRAGQSNSEFKEGTAFIPFEKVEEIHVLDNEKLGKVKMMRSKDYK